MLQEIMQFVSRHPILSLAWIVLLVAVIVMTFKSRFSKVKEIARGEATLLINKEDAVIVDTRSRDDFRRGHIANAINLTASELKGGSYGELEKHKAQPVIVVCANGTTSREPAEHLSKAGFEKVYTLKDGVAGWSGENLPLVRGK
ncbi:rhodanese-like domain-containing protein [Serratia aquatilis]|uniref:Rhodanese-like domain-containing protein n=1 Tax=Serratia aquatilis TaxID=1737515 RepID=A0ABV6EC01_9GAMM